MSCPQYFECTCDAWTEHMDGCDLRERQQVQHAPPFDSMHDGGPDFIHGRHLANVIRCRGWLVELRPVRLQC
jgi:hypothetical protein